MACGTCHDVHADAKRSQVLLRHPDDKSSTTWCATCHTDMKSIMTSAHSEPMMRKHVAGGQEMVQTSFCAPCHAVHVPKAGVASGTPTVGAGPAPAGPQEYPADMRACLGCHGQGGKATQVKVTIHPIVPMRNAAASDAPGYLPLVDEKGGLGPEGRITCRTCHVPHGRPPGAGMPAIDPSKVTDEELHDLATLLRPYTAPNLCTGCHGVQGLNHYLYYHFPEKRG